MSKGSAGNEHWTRRESTSESGDNVFPALSGPLSLGPDGFNREVRLEFLNR